MNVFPNRSLAGPQAPAVSIARDVARIVITAVLAGTAFAILLALTVLSLTVIAPPAQASGAPVTVTETPVNGGGSGTGAVTAAPIHLAAANPQSRAEAKEPPQVAVHEQMYESLEKSKLPVVLYIVLALLAGLLGYFGYIAVKGKS
jgi:uncharacterized protein (DUF58 family)